MIDFNFINGNITHQEKEVIKETFLSNLKEFRQEFEQKATGVTINLKADPAIPQFAEFSFGNNVDELVDFISRFQKSYPKNDS